MRFGQDPVVVLQRSWLLMTSQPPACTGMQKGAQHQLIACSLGGLVYAGQSADCGQTGVCLLITL